MEEPDPDDASFEGNEDNGFEDAGIDEVPHHNNVLERAQEEGEVHVPVDQVLPPEDANQKLLHRCVVVTQRGDNNGEVSLCQPACSASCPLLFCYIK